MDSREVHREIVSALELVKKGMLDEATTTIDSIGPHLTNESIGLILHITLILTQLGRIDDVNFMLERAHSLMPGNEDVSSAIDYFSKNNGNVRL